MSFTLVSFLALLATVSASPIGPIPASIVDNAPTATVIASEPHYTATQIASYVNDVTASVSASSFQNGPTATQIASSVFDGPTATVIASSVFDGPTATVIASSVFDGPTATVIASSVFDGPTATVIASSVFNGPTATVIASSVFSGPTATVIASGGDASGYPGCSHTGYAVIPASAETAAAKYRFTMGGNIV